MNTVEELEKIGSFLKVVDSLDVDDAFRIINSGMCLKYGPMWLNDSNMGKKKPKDFPQEDTGKTPFDDIDASK